MKKLLRIVAAVMILSLLMVAPLNKVKAQVSASINIGTFYSELSPYGQWVDDPQYGLIWIPDVEPGFRPYYSGGHWVMTSYGAMWVSDYRWGWAPFHYGRWVYTSFYGWVWIPDTTWGPAWVTWRWGDGYAGWAPLGPGISVSLSFGSGYSVPNDWWVFVPQRYYLSSGFYDYAIPFQQNVTYVTRTSVINNTYVNDKVTYVAGPRISDVQQATGNKVQVYDVANASQPGATSLAGGAVKTYRPQVTKNENARPPDVISKEQFTKNKPEQRAPKTSEPRQQTERPAQQKNDRQTVEERRQQVRQPSSQTIERKLNQVQIERQMKEQRSKQVKEPPPQVIERKPVQQNDNREVKPAPKRSETQPPAQQKRQSPAKQQPNPSKKKGKG